MLAPAVFLRLGVRARRVPTFSAARSATSTCTGWRAADFFAKKVSERRSLGDAAAYRAGANPLVNKYCRKTNRKSTVINNEKR